MLRIVITIFNKLHLPFYGIVYRYVLNTVERGRYLMLQSLIFDMDGTLFQTDKILELSLDDT